MHNIFKHSRVLSQEDDCSTTSRISGDIRRQRLTSRRSIDKAHSEAEMDEAGQQKGVTAAFPPPPAFWKHFSQHNLDKLEELKRDKEAAQDGEKVDWSPEALAGLDVPPELQCLIPPKLPEHEFLLFGESQLLAPNPPSLQEQGIEQLYPSSLTEEGETGKRQSSHAFYLTKIAKSLMLNFLEFVGILAICPEQFEAKLEDIRNLFINAHHLLNLYRPHQARESLILMMERQLQKSREEIQQMDEMKDRAEEFLAKLKSEGHDAENSDLDQVNGDGEPSTVKVESKVEEFHAMWKALDEIDDS